MGRGRRTTIASTPAPSSAGVDLTDLMFTARGRLPDGPIGAPLPAPPTARVVVLRHEVDALLDAYRGQPADERGIAAATSVFEHADWDRMGSSIEERISVQLTEAERRALVGFGRADAEGRAIVRDDAVFEALMGRLERAYEASYRDDEDEERSIRHDDPEDVRSVLAGPALPLYSPDPSWDAEALVAHARLDVDDVEYDERGTARRIRAAVTVRGTAPGTAAVSAWHAIDGADERHYDDALAAAGVEAEAAFGRLLEARYGGDAEELLDVLDRSDMPIS